ncbi:6-carboxyhexanoate--CoA ligase [Halalkalibacter urbisdiaboli]|uniref:6-carboxyhexanoate--CoA ligase n=1 Tax=Halalkalibacter urbisdiaboli TaxID=1960589 RepID=UPI000B43D402|nr:6-carboxyhexanoate--CoA ligase [Halalkalibacter urbisdiaboli]
MQENYSIRMRAAKGGGKENGGKHISGGEMLVPLDGIKGAITTLVNKALTHSRGKPDFMQIQVDLVTECFQFLEPLHSQTSQVPSLRKGRQLAVHLLKMCEIDRDTIDNAIAVLSKNGGMRGAMIIDIHTGERVDMRGQKGIRVSRMDWEQQNFERWAATHQLPLSLRVKEAMTLATKVANHPNTVAELCWSDDPDYVMGYVASKKLGYQRISKLKEFGDERGGRVFFVKGCEDIEAYIEYLEKKPVYLVWEAEHDRVN